MNRDFERVAFVWTHPDRSKVLRLRALVAVAPSPTSALLASNPSSSTA